jgi:dihydroorotate dehydrogenase
MAPRMPDWSYHPFFKPLLFRLPGEDARRLTLALLAIQSKTAPGRRLFRLFGHGVPTGAHAVDAFGLRFPGPVGLASGIDTHGEALAVLQYLDLGFLVVGPLGLDALPRRFEADPIRVREALAIVSGEEAAAPSAEEMAARLRTVPDLAVPIGVALRGDRLADAARALEGAASFFVIPPRSAENAETLRALREATRRPILLTCAPEWDDARLDALTDAAGEAGLDGLVALAGEPSDLVRGGGRASGPFLRARALAAVERLARRHGDRLPVVGAGGVMSPDDVSSFLDAGAKLVQLYEGLVYAGPGLPARIAHALDHHQSHPAPVPVPVPVPVPPPLAPHLDRYARWGRFLIAFTGSILIASGLFALILAATVKLLPYDVAYLGMTMDDLCARAACRVVHFMAHDRVSFGGSIISIGILYIWIAGNPLRAGEPWAFWALVASGVVGFGSFLTYIGYGYLDVWHGRATLALLPFTLAGLVLSHAGLRKPRGPAALFRSSARAWLWSPAGMGRACLTFAAIGMLMGGAIIMTVGMTRVFVPQDLAYMGVTADELRTLNPRLVPLIAHDRAGFGGGLFSGGILVMSTVWCGLRPGARSLWWALAASGIAGFGCAIGVHPVVGYTSFVHLAPAYAGALSLVVGLVLLYRPLCRWDGEQGARFPDL